jgi:hypothetical protein
VRLYTWRRTGLADEVGCDAIPDAAGGEGGHGAAKPDGAIHRYVYYRLYRDSRFPSTIAMIQRALSMSNVECKHALDHLVFRIPHFQAMPPSVELL